MQEGLKRESQRQEAQQRQALIQEEGRQQRLTNAQKATLTAEEEKSAASKPLTTKQYLDARNAVARNKELDEKTTSRWKAFGMSLPFGPRDATPTEREEQMEQIDVATIKNGEPTAVKAAKANLKRSVLKRLGLLGTPVNPEGRALLQNELQQYGLTMADMQ
jgi:2-keto-4-pentenoate hydratase/2-oxohepta-3-ene-1,7-dioic acid hydratase in catechol pathway